jgi:hypothetical protein
MTDTQSVCVICGEEIIEPGPSGDACAVCEADFV